jgi:hypothetical protein
MRTRRFKGGIPFKKLAAAGIAGILAARSVSAPSYKSELKPIHLQDYVFNYENQLPSTSPEYEDHVENSIKTWGSNSLNSYLSAPKTEHNYIIAKPPLIDEHHNLEQYLKNATQEELTWTLEEMKNAWEGNITTRTHTTFGDPSREFVSRNATTLRDKFASLGEYLMTRYHNLRQTSADTVRKAILDYTATELMRKPTDLSTFKERFLSDPTKPNENFKRLLNEFNTSVILNVKILRREVLNSDSLMELAPELSEVPYHIGLLFETSNGPLIIEKEPNLVMFRVVGDLPDMETMDLQDFIQFSPYTTVGEYILNTQQIMGDNFYKYDATDANCQGFARDSLEALGLWSHLSEEAKSSVVQKDLKLSTSKAKVANTLAQLRMRFNHAVSKGGKRNKKKTRRGKKSK